MTISASGWASDLEVIDLNQVASDRWHLVNRAPTVVTEGERSILRFDERAGGGMAWDPALQLTDGDIEVDVRGRNVAQKSFLGIAFHVSTDDSLEVLWLRPFNFESPDPERRSHSVQYADYPQYSWQVLREQRPGLFEAAVPAEIKADDWVHMRLEIRGAHLKVFLNASPTPVLTVEAPGERTSGGIGLWVGDQSTGDFANLVARPLSDRR